MRRQKYLQTPIIPIVGSAGVEGTTIYRYLILTVGLSVPIAGCTLVYVRLDPRVFTYNVLFIYRQFSKMAVAVTLRGSYEIFPFTVDSLVGEVEFVGGGRRGLEHVVAAAAAVEQLAHGRLLQTVLALVAEVGGHGVHAVPPAAAGARAGALRVARAAPRTLVVVAKYIQVVQYLPRYARLPVLRRRTPGRGGGRGEGGRRGVGGVAAGPRVLLRDATFANVKLSLQVGRRGRLRGEGERVGGVGRAPEQPHRRPAPPRHAGERHHPIVQCYDFYPPRPRLF